MKWYTFNGTELSHPSINGHSAAVHTCTCASMCKYK